MRREQRSLVLAFLFVTASFVAATVYSQLRMAQVDQSAANIARTNAPSIEQLVLIRSDVTGLAGGLRDMARERAPFDEHRVGELERSLDHDVEAYLTLAPPALEREQEARLTRTARALLRAADRMTDAMKAHDFLTARRMIDDEVAPAGTLLSSEILGAMTSASKDAIVLAESIESTRESSMRVAFVLNLLCIVAASFAAVVVSRVVRAYGAIAESRNALLASRADELEAFAARVAHDLVNPLGAIRLNLEMVAMRAEAQDDKRVCARTIRGVDRATFIVRDLLAFARASASPDPEASVDLRMVAENLTEELSDEARAAGVTLDAEEIPARSVACAPGILTSILSNLVRNAIKYMGERPVRAVTIRGRERGRSVEVEVVDTGPGIPAANLAEIWQPYVRGSATAGRPGIGLGLATVKRLVEGHGGTVSVRSAPGQGSVFSFLLPLR